MGRKPTTGTTRTGPNESGFDHRALDRATRMSHVYSGGQYNSAVAGMFDDDQLPGERGGGRRPGRADRMADDADNGGVNGAMGGFCADC